MKSNPTRCHPRPLLPLALAVSLLLGLCLGCQTLGLSSSAAPSASSSEPAAQGETLNRILEAGVLRVGMTGTQPPLNMKNKKGELVGLDVELAQSLADAMKLELVLVETPFSDLLSDLEAGKIDLVISSLTITPARNARVAFAGPYLISGASLLTRDDLVETLKTQESLDSEDRSWAALTGSTGEELIREAFPKARFVGITDQQVAVGEVADGKIDGLIADLPSVRYLLSRNPGRGLAMLPSPFTTEPLGIALPPHSPLFANLVQNYLNTLRYTGELIQMKARWLNEGEWLSEMPEP